MNNEFITTENVIRFDGICQELEDPISRIGPSLAMVTSPAGRGKTEAYETELHNIQTGVMAMLADGTTGNLTSTYSGVYEMNTVITSGATGNLSLDQYLTGLGDSPTTAGTTETTAPKSGCNYDFAVDGTVTQNIPS